MQLIQFHLIIPCNHLATKDNESGVQISDFVSYVNNNNGVS